LGGVEVVGVKAGVVESAAKIGVAILEELDFAASGLSVDLDVSLRNRLPPRPTG
jgi:hypothetical protein